jgi:FkbM family methyltransferase
MAQERTFVHTLALLRSKGVRYATVIDLGCADGHFFLELCLRGYFLESVPINIDANPLYEPSLRLIQEAIGGHYRIAAAVDQTGEIELTTAVHPYWGSTRPDGDPYWERVNQLRSGVEIVPAVRLDDLADELKLTPPYLLKLDVQGSEVLALRGARRILNDTSVVICEADVADFRDINTELTSAGFDLYDITSLHYAADSSLGWFYPVYINSRLANVVDPRIWQAKDDAAVIQAQVARRETVVARLPEILEKLKSMRAKSTV